MEQDTILMSISDLAQEIGVTPRTIRYYEEVGLITPIYMENVNQRLYGTREKARLKLILRGKYLGFSLAEIKEMIDLYDIDRTEKRQLQRTLEYGQKRIQEIDEKIRDLSALKEELLDYQHQFTQILKRMDLESTK